MTLSSPDLARALARALAAIDAANAADPGLTEGRPAALVYGERMSAELALVAPGAGPLLQLAARGQHIERWLLPRSAFPEGKAGYLDWRREQGRRHGQRVGQIALDCGFGPADADRLGVLLRKEGIKRDPEVQLLEDVACHVFLAWYFADFAQGKAPDQVLDIVRKTARKMSAGSRARALARFDLPPALAAALDLPG